jgi:hypothetical protein
MSKAPSKAPAGDSEPTSAPKGWRPPETALDCVVKLATYYHAAIRRGTSEYRDSEFESHLERGTLINALDTLVHVVLCKGFELPDELVSLIAWGGIEWDKPIPDGLNREFCRRLFQLEVFARKKRAEILRAPRFKVHSGHEGGKGPRRFGVSRREANRRVSAYIKSQTYDHGAIIPSDIAEVTGLSTKTILSTQAWNDYELWVPQGDRAPAENSPRVTPPAPEATKPGDSPPKNGPVPPLGFMWEGSEGSFLGSERRFYRLLFVTWSSFRTRTPLTLEEVNHRLVADGGSDLEEASMRNYARDLSAILTERFGFPFELTVCKDIQSVAFVQWAKVIGTAAASP